MTTRVLRADEYARLAGTELEPVAPHLRPCDQVLVVEDTDGAIIGCWALLMVPHVEGVWVAPEHRGKSGVARRLLAGMRRLVGDGRPVMTGATTDDVRRILAGLGATKLPGDHYVFRFGE